MLKKIKRFIILIVIAFCTMSTSWVLLYKWAPVKWTPLMLKRTVQNIGVEGYNNTRTWVDIENISPVMVRAVLASEDGRFMEHWGFDIKELIKDKVDGIVDKIKSDKTLMTRFKSEPVKVVEELIGIDLPDDQIEKLVEAVKAKINLDKVGGLLGGLFGKK